jgi:hypothetical protein
VQPRHRFEARDGLLGQLERAHRREPVNRLLDGPRPVRVDAQHRLGAECIADGFHLIDVPVHPDLELERLESAAGPGDRLSGHVIRLARRQRRVAGHRPGVRGAQQPPRGLARDLAAQVE